MELASYKSFIEKLIADDFKLETFSPENSGKLFDIFKEIFYRDTPYWKESHIDNGMIYIELKKYGENRKQIFFAIIFSIQFKKTKRVSLSSN